MSAPITRRGLVGRAVAAGAGMSLASPPVALASPVRPAVDDPVLALIAEEARLRDIGSEFRERADLMLFALPVDQRLRFAAMDERSLPDPFRALYQRAAAHERPANKLYDRILVTRAMTLAGVVAQFRLFDLDYGERGALVLAGLRDIQARGGVA